MGARYSRNAGYTISKRSVGRAPVRTTQKQLRFGPSAAKFFGLAVLAIMAFLAVGASGEKATNPYDQSVVRKNTSQVEKDISDLELQSERYKAVESIKNTAAKDSMVPADPDYSVEKGSVAGVSTGTP